MLTKRDKILVQPWEQRKYDNHIRKVQTALPVIDNKPPISREHVAVKLKKRVKEVERIKKIEHENLILLRKMNYIMKTNRVDNYWNKPLPNFLNRVTMFNNIRRPITEELEIFEEENGNHIKKGKCSACTPKPVPPKNTPEERIPWEPPKPQISRKRSKSVPVRKNSLPTILEKNKIPSASAEKPKSSKESRMLTPSKKLEDNNKRQLKKYKSYEDCYENTNSQKLIITRGSLKLCVKFPSDSQIKLQDGNVEKTILKAKCYCRKSIEM